VPLFMSIHTLPPGAFTPERIEEIARLGQTDPHVKGYRSFHSLAEGRIVWMLDAPSKEAVEDWCRRVGLPLDGVTALELEGFVGNIKPARTAIPNQLAVTVESLVRDGLAVLATLRLMDGGGVVVALLDTDECDAMGLTVGASVLALIKATNVSVEKTREERDPMKLSFPNQIKGRVTNIISSTTLVIVYIDTPGGQVVSAMIPSAAEQIELKVGDEVTALFKALDVSLAKG
jgi:molybdate transport system regulatory protein